MKKKAYKKRKTIKEKEASCLKKKERKNHPI